MLPQSIESENGRDNRAPYGRESVRRLIAETSGLATRRIMWDSRKRWCFLVGHNSIHLAMS